MLNTQRRLFWRIFLSYLFLIVMGIFLVGGLSLGRIKTFYLHNIERGLEARANLAAQVVEPLMLDPDGEVIDALVKRLGHASSTRITVTDLTGFVLGDSERSPKTIDNLFNRPEVLIALQGDTGESTHFSETLMDDMKYVAVPIKMGESQSNEAAILGVVRVALTTDGDSFAPVVSPDGDQIAYLHRDGVNIDLRVLTLDLSDGTITLVDDQPVTNDGAIDASSSPAWYIPEDQLTPRVDTVDVLESVLAVDPPLDDDTLGALAP